MKINLYSRTPISFTIQFQTLIFVIFVNRANVRVAHKNSGNLVYLQYSRETLYYFEFLNLLPVSEHLIYLCSNPFELPKFSLHLCILPRCLNI